MWLPKRRSSKNYTQPVSLDCVNCSPGDGSTASVKVAAQLAARNFSVHIEVPAGKTMAILGPNGSGKSTLLSIISGLLVPDAGKVVLDDTPITDLSAGISTAPHLREVGILTQQPLLFPHLSVAENVQFGPRSIGLARQASPIANYWLNRVGLADLAHRKPSQLSGGQASRVALARALATDPKVMLLDEPMAALDVSVSGQMRRLLSDVLRNRTTLLVTHDLLDVLAMADLVTVIEDGHIAETGSVTQVLNSPRSSFGARLAGLNLVRGKLDAEQVLAGDGLTVWGKNSDALIGEDAVALFSPSEVSIYREEVSGSPRNSWLVEVQNLVAMPNSVRVRAKVGGQVLLSDISAAAANNLDLREGDRVFFTVKQNGVKLHRAKSQ